MTLEEWRAKQRPRAARVGPTEAGEQMALVTWRDTILSREPRLARLIHIPNGEFRHKATAGRLKAMGVVPGVPDLILPVRSRGFSAAAIELKAPGGSVADAQDDWLAHLRDEGWAATVCIGWVAAARWLCWYLDQSPSEMGLEDC